MIAVTDGSWYPPRRVLPSNGMHYPRTKSTARKFLPSSRRILGICEGVYLPLNWRYGSNVTTWEPYLIFYLVHNTFVGNNKYDVGQALLFFMLSWTCMIYCQLFLLRYAPASLIHSWSFSPSPYALIADREPQQQTVLGNRRHPIDDFRSTARATSGTSYPSSLCLLCRTYSRCICEPGLYRVTVVRKLRKSKCSVSKSYLW